MAPSKRIHAFDDDGSDDFDNSSGDDSSGGDSRDGAGSGFDDGGSGGDFSDPAGDTPGGDDAGAGFDDGSSGGDVGGADAPAIGGDAPTDTPANPVDDTGASGTGGSTTPVDDGSEYALLHPDGTYCDDDLYGSGVFADGNAGGTADGLGVSTRGPNFGGTIQVHLPAHPVAGDAGVATVHVFNTGGRAAGRFDLVLGATPDGSAADAVKLVDDRVAVHLGHDRVANYRVPFKLPANLPPGSFQALVLVDADNDFHESDEADNVAIGPRFTVAAATADLSVTAATTRPTARAGKPTSLTVRLANAGNGVEAGPATFTVTAEPTDGSAAAIALATVTRRVRVAAHGRGFVAMQVKLPALPAGSYRLVVSVAPPIATDVNTLDKSAAAPFTVMPVRPKRT